MGINIWFSVHSFETVTNILMLLGRIIDRSNWSMACKTVSSSCLHFLIISPDPYFYFSSGLYLSIIFMPPKELRVAY